MGQKVHPLIFRGLIYKNYLNNFYINISKNKYYLINILFFVKHKFTYGPSETRHSTGAGDEHERSNNLLLHVAPKSIRDYKCAPKFLAGATLLLRATSEHQSDKWMERGLRGTVL